MGMGLWREMLSISGETMPSDGDLKISRGTSRCNRRNTGIHDGQCPIVGEGALEKRGGARIWKKCSLRVLRIPGSESATDTWQYEKIIPLSLTPSRSTPPAVNTVNLVSHYIHNPSSQGAASSSTATSIPDPLFEPTPPP